MMLGPFWNHCKTPARYRHMLAIVTFLSNSSTICLKEKAKKYNINPTQKEDEETKTEARYIDSIAIAMFMNIIILLYMRGITKTSYQPGE